MDAPELNLANRETAVHPLGRLVPALIHRNFRLFSAGQALSITGTWMQDVAQGWYVLTKTNSPIALGAVMAAEYVPILLFSPIGGALADRHDRRRLIVLAQLFLGVAALMLGVAVSLNSPLPYVFALAVLRGLAGCVDLPARYAYLSQIVAEERLRSATAFNSFVWNVGRAVGPILAAGVIATAGIAACFYVNALTYVALLVLVMMMDGKLLSSVRLTPKARVVDGWRYLHTNADVRAGLLTLVFVGTFAYNTATIFPMLARFAFSGQVGAAAQLITAAGVGAMLAGLYMSRRSAPSRRQVVLTGLLFAGAIGATSAAPSLVAATMCTFTWGATNAIYASTVNSFIQLRCAPEYRGRIMAFWSSLVYGSTAVGAPAIGLIAHFASARLSVGFISLMTFVASMAAILTFRRHPEAVPAEVEKQSGGISA